MQDMANLGRRAMLLGGGASLLASCARPTPPFTDSSGKRLPDSIAALMRLYNAPIENHLTMAYWDQRGARLDLTEAVPALDVPVTFVLGRFDQRTWSPLAVVYLEALRAPSKRLIWLENSAHNGPFEEPGAFRAAVIDAIFAAT